MGALPLTEALVEVEAEAENQEGDVVGSVVGEVGEGVGTTEGEAGEDVESNVRLYNIQIVPSGNYLDRISILCQSVRVYTLIDTGAHAQGGPSEDGRGIPQRVVAFAFVVPVLGPYPAKASIDHICDMAYTESSLMNFDDELSSIRRNIPYG